MVVAHLMVNITVITVVDVRIIIDTIMDLAGIMIKSSNITVRVAVVVQVMVHIILIFVAVAHTIIDTTMEVVGTMTNCRTPTVHHVVVVGVEVVHVAVAQV